MIRMASANKVAYHREKLESYLSGDRVYPATLELDIGTECNRSCPLCPSTTSPNHSSLDIKFIERLLGRLAGETRGLLLSGGEPTMAKNFPETLRIARDNDFLEIAVVTNGGFLGVERIADALISYASTIRVSLYDWSKESPRVLDKTLRRIEGLRNRIDSNGSKLEIGISALTRAENVETVSDIARRAASAGAHWIYFHPMCIRWDIGEPERVNQQGAIERITACRDKLKGVIAVFTFPDRYIERELVFEQYHAAHFLLVIGADGKNYLGAEVKYQPQHLIADLGGEWDDDFLWREDRVNRISNIDSRRYPAMGSRHRGILYSGIIQGMFDRGVRSLDGFDLAVEKHHSFPHVL